MTSMGLLDFARAEIAAIRALVPESDNEYDNAVYEDVLQLLEVFADQGHSGLSAAIVLSVFEKLARYKPLCPLTGDDSEWSEPIEPDGTRQNRRAFHVFKRPDGTAYDIEAVIFRNQRGSTFTSRDSIRDITFPYTPKREYVDVIEELEEVGPGPEESDATETVVLHACCPSCDCPKPEHDCRASGCDPVCDS